MLHSLVSSVRARLRRAWDMLKQAAAFLLVQVPAATRKCLVATATIAGIIDVLAKVVSAWRQLRGR